ncbi:flagellar hook-length control protein FliK [Paenibacillus sp. sgz500958]|uniref:flagellar hook-length control protein FliK n=1 Tax=Paenibacillus sp. sgz500958 TaxID=3242475 RepID=UPI0036D3E18C
MGLVFQMISAGNGLTSNSASTTAGQAGNAEATGTLLPFAAALIQKMSGAVEGADTSAVVPADALTLLQGLLKDIKLSGASEDKAVTEGNDVLSTLTENVENLDDSITNNPDLLAQLQAWLLQVATLLTGSVQPEAQGQYEETAAPALSPLAQNPETLRFAVQDDLNRLVHMIQEAASTGDETSTVKGLSLLNQFSDLMTEAIPASDKSKQVIQTTPASSQGMTMKTENLQTSIPAASASSSENQTDLAGTLQTKVTVKADSKETVTEEESATDFAVPDKGNEVVTAGQLALRGGITAPLKVETPKVPVHQFAKEMTGMITGKLEIVRKEGFAEATISLFPDNLGQVDVKISMQNGHLVAQFVTEHAAAKDLLEQQMVQLKAALQSQGLQVEKLEVTQNNTPLQSQMQQEGRQPGSGGRQSDKRSKNDNEAVTDAILTAELNEEWKDWVENGSSADGQGGSFSAKA